MNKCPICQRPVSAFRRSIWHGSASNMKFVHAHAACKRAADAEFLRGCLWEREEQSSRKTRKSD